MFVVVVVRVVTASSTGYSIFFDFIFESHKTSYLKCKCVQRYKEKIFYVFIKLIVSFSKLITRIYVGTINLI